MRRTFAWTGDLRLCLFVDSPWDVDTIALRNWSVLMRSMGYAPGASTYAGRVLEVVDAFAPLRSLVVETGRCGLDPQCSCFLCESLQT